MSELLKNEIGDNKISKKVGEISWLKNSVTESYKAIYESGKELQDLKTDATQPISDKKLNTLLENELTIEHVKNVLNQAVTAFDEARTTEKQKATDAHTDFAERSVFMDVYNKMGAGLVFNMQLGLAKLGCTFKSGIDGLYGSKDTIHRVKEFQTAWNTAHPDALLTVDGRAGEQTLKNIVVALGDASWKKENIVSLTAVPASGNNKTEKPVGGKDKKDKVPFLSHDEAAKDDATAAANHLVYVDDKWQPADGYEWVNGDDENNYATKKIETPKPSTKVENKEKPKEEKNKEKTEAEKKKEVSKKPEDKTNNGKSTTDKQETIKEKGLSRAEAIKDKASMEKNHLGFVPADADKDAPNGYEFADKNDPDNYAMKKKGESLTTVPKVTRQDIINDPEGKKYHVQIQPYDGYTWVDENAKDNYATKLKEKAVVTNTPVKTENEQSTAAPEKQDIYTQAAQEMQDILDGKGEYKDKDIVEKYKAIEKRFQKAYDEFNKPAEGSNIIKIRDQAFTNVIEYLQNDFALTKPLGKEVLFSHFKKLADYKNIFPKKIGGKVTNALQPYIKNYMAEAFAGTTIDTKNFMLSDISTRSNSKLGEGVYGEFHSYKKETEIYLPYWIGELDIKFADINETMRVANLINKLKSTYPYDGNSEIKDQNFDLTGTNALRHMGMKKGTGIMKDKMGYITVLDNYDLFPSLQGEANNANKKKFVDYLNKKINEAGKAQFEEDKKAMTRGDFEAGLPTNVTMWNGGANGVNYEQEFKNDLNQLTLLKLNQVTDQLTKEGYVIDDKQELILRGANELVKSSNETPFIQIDMKQPKEAMLAYLRTVLKKK